IVGGPGIVDAQGADYLSVLFVDNGEHVLLFHKAPQNFLAVFPGAVMGPACHLAHTWNRGIGEKILKIAFLPGPQNETLSSQYNAGNVNSLLHDCPSMGEMCVLVVLYNVLPCSWRVNRQGSEAGIRLGLGNHHTIG